MTCPAERDLRAELRSNVFLAAKLCAASRSFPVRVRNVSAWGALVDGTDLPPVGIVVHLRRGDLSVEGDIAWSRANERGLRFSAAVKPDEWTKRVGHAGQQRVDRIMQAIRSSGGSRQPAPVVGASRAQFPPLDTLAASLAEACERLASLPDMRADLAEELLRLESIAQALRGWSDNHTSELERARNRAPLHVQRMP